MVSAESAFFAELHAHMETTMSRARTIANTFFILFLHISNFSLIQYKRTSKLPFVPQCETRTRLYRTKIGCSVENVNTFVFVFCKTVTMHKNSIPFL